jgi:hypothetical protein
MNRYKITENELAHYLISPQDAGLSFGDQSSAGTENLVWFASPEQYWRTYFKFFFDAYASASEEISDPQTFANTIIDVCKCMAEVLTALSVDDPLRKHLIVLLEDIQKNNVEYFKNGKSIIKDLAQAALLAYLIQRNQDDLFLKNYFIYRLFPELMPKKDKTKVAEIINSSSGQEDKNDPKEKPVITQGEISQKTREAGDESTKPITAGVVKLHEPFPVEKRRISDSVINVISVEASAKDQDENWRSQLVSIIDRLKPCDYGAHKLTCLLPIGSNREPGGWGSRGVVVTWFGICASKRASSKNEITYDPVHCKTILALSTNMDKECQIRVARLSSEAVRLLARVSMFAKEADFLAESINSDPHGDRDYVELMAAILRDAESDLLKPLIAFPSRAGVWFRTVWKALRPSHQEDQVSNYRHLLSYLVQHQQRYERVLAAYGNLIPSDLKIEEAVPATNALNRYKQALKDRIDAFSADYMDWKERTERRSRFYMNSLQAMAAVFVLFTIGQVAGGWWQNRNNADDRAYQMLMEWKINSDDLRNFSSEHDAKVYPKSTTQSDDLSQQTPTDLIEKYNKIMKYDMAPYAWGGLFVLASLFVFLIFHFNAAMRIIDVISRSINKAINEPILALATSFTRTMRKPRAISCSINKAIIEALNKEWSGVVLGFVCYSLMFWLLALLVK